MRRLLVSAACALPLLVPAHGARALNDLVLEAGPISGRGWSIEHVRTRIRVAAGAGRAAVVEARGVRLPGPFARIQGLTARCAVLKAEAGGVSCDDGELRVHMGEGAPAYRAARFNARYGAKGLRLELEGLGLDGGRVDAVFESETEAFRFDLEFRRFPLEGVGPLLDVPGPRLDAQDGTVTGTLSLHAAPGNHVLSAALSLSRWAFSDESGLNAGENVDLTVALEASRKRAPWMFRVDAGLAAGQVYLHPLFIDAANGAVKVEASGRFDEAQKRVELEEIRYHHLGVGELIGAGSLSLEPAPAVERVSFATQAVALDRLYRVYMKPWLLQTVFSDLKVSGRVALSLDWGRGKASRADVEMAAVDLEDGRARFGVQGLNGTLRWRDGAQPEITRLGFESARFFRIDVGAAELAGYLSGRDFELESPLVLPLLGGALRISELKATGVGGDEFSWRLGGALAPISVEALTRSLGWPEFGGTLSGEIPLLRYQERELNVDGTLSMRAFDGRVDIDNLRLSRPLGVVPRAAADIRLSNLSLGALTRTFSFGNIEGRLSGRIDDLVLENWRPTAFDAAFATPEDDTSRHRISQRAVENLARLGGAGRVLSSTVLRFLKAFSYDRLGLSCRLKDGVCEMGGVKDAPSGYYIVVGGGLPPRIDVFGYNRRVDWNTLVERLKSVTRSKGAVIR